MKLPIVTALVGFMASLAGAKHMRTESTFSPARPPSIPLAVRNPYLNLWLDGEPHAYKTGYLPGSWPRHWTGSIVGWEGLVRVDGKAYNWMGSAFDEEMVDQVAFEYTSTRSTFTMEVNGTVGMRVNFLTPVTADDIKRQSLTYSYLEIEVYSLDDKEHDVQVYCDISGELASGDRREVIDWGFGVVGEIIFQSFRRKRQRPVTEAHEQPNWGNWFWSTQARDGLTWQVGTHGRIARSKFIEDGSLDNEQDLDYRSINHKWPVFAYSMDFGTIDSKTNGTILYTLGLSQVEGIRFLGDGGIRVVPQLWMSYFDHEIETLHYFYHDFKKMVAHSKDVDRQVAEASLAAGGQDLLTITSLTVRQTFGAVQLTNTPERPMLFLKEISSNSDIQTVDVIFPAHPLYLWFNPKTIKWLLDPLFENQESGHYPHNSAIHDLGTYPNAHGYPDGHDEPMPLEECGNMLIMVLAYYQRSGDQEYLEEHYSILKQWSGYLIEDSLIPSYQLSTDDFAGRLANQTNLAIKGIIGLKAMAVISETIGEYKDAKYFGAIADDYLGQWQGFGIAHDAEPPHTTLRYGKNETHGLLYNLYGDALLGLDFVPKSIYKMQSDFYPTIVKKYGVPLDTRHDYTKTDWELWAAATSERDTQDLIHARIAKWLNETTTWRAFTDLYETKDGTYPGNQFTARPVVGGAFALLVMPDAERSELERWSGWDEVEKEEGEGTSGREGEGIHLVVNEEL
ncbi:hypothetical protein MKZ38_005157 [Zalerion maritima]|uniref:Glutaminase GtaA n=1 Tax=Zalerion maritima TaxID=339359 RepID=A0AAD5RW54_9PEZI|nr:hypothetical protein MKZ38_005157 [Zalerion maritima]